MDRTRLPLDVDTTSRPIRPVEAAPGSPNVVVVLIDDIYASGATSAACTGALLAAGAESVTILCWARVLNDTDY